MMKAKYKSIHLLKLIKKQLKP